MLKFLHVVVVVFIFEQVVIISYLVINVNLDVVYFQKKDVE